MEIRTFLFVVNFHLIMCTAFSSFAQSREQKNNADIKKLFDAAAKIQLFSYPAHYEYVDENGAPKEDTYFVAKELRIPKRSIKETLTLSAKQRDALLKLLLLPVPLDLGTRSVVFCYDPRHAIIFYDARAQPAAYIELCLECGNYEMSPRLNLDFYYGNRGTYRNLFQSFGVKYLGPDGN